MLLSPAPYESPVGRPSPGAALALVGVLVATALTLPAGMNNDIKYEVGTQATSPSGPALTFTHRPLPYRLLMAALARPAAALTDSYAGFELALRAEAGVLVALAGLVLWRGLCRVLPDHAASVAVVAAGTTLLMGANLALEPDWLAVVLVMAAVGAGLLLRQVTPAALLAGVLLTVAAVLKITTLSVAGIGLLALLVLDRRRGLAAMAVATVAGVAYVGLVAAAIPQELQWVLDSAAIQPDRDVAEQARLGLESLGDAAIMWPVLLAVPASLVGASRREKLLILGAVGIALAGVVVQAQYYTYHFAPLVAVAALCVLGILRRSRLGLVPALVAVGTACAVLLSVPAAVRVEVRPLWFGLAAAAAVGLAVGQQRLRQRQGHGDQPAPVTVTVATATATMLALALPAVLPIAAWSFSVQPARVTTALTHAESAGEREAAGELVRERIGPDTVVTYLAFGDTPYYVRNPTACPYPTNVFLQRSRYYDKHEDTVSWRDNLRCLDDQRPAWVVIDETWFKLRAMPPAITDGVTGSFDCSRAFAAAPWTVCPRRT